MFDVLCVSDCCCDLIFQGLARVPAPGTEEYCRDLHLQAGGGANTPMGLARLGSRTAYLTAVGGDSLGRLVREDLRRAGVAPDFWQQRQGGRTWVSAVLSTHEDRAFASYAGEDVSCTEEQLKELVRQVRWVHTYTYYCERFPFLPRVCQRAGVPLSLDATFGEDVTLKNVEALLGQAELFTPNDREACQLTGEQDPFEALKRLGQVCPNVVVTMGEKGSLALLDGKTYQILPPQVEMVDANGAGDLFDAGLIWARLTGRDTEAQLRTAAASGALAVTYPGGLGPAYSRARVEELANQVQIRGL